MKSGVPALLRKGRTNLQAAQLLSEQGYADIAASRAYYAMFYAAEAVLLERGFSFSSHSAVIAAFGRELVKPGILPARLHRYLIDAQDLRNLADYGIAPSATAEQISEMLSWAFEFLAEAERLLRAQPGQE